MAQNLPKKLAFDLKRCPHCSVELPLDTMLCSNCKKKVGKVDKLGRAREPVDWKAYTICVFSWLLFVFFVWWGFFKEGK